MKFSTMAYLAFPCNLNMLKSLKILFCPNISMEGPDDLRESGFVYGIQKSWTDSTSLRCLFISACMKKHRSAPWFLNKIEGALKTLISTIYMATVSTMYDLSTVLYISCTAANLYAVRCRAFATACFTANRISHSTPVPGLHLFNPSLLLGYCLIALF